MGQTVRGHPGGFFGLDVLLPLAVLIANPKAPITVYALAILAYLALLTGYVAI